MTKRHLTALALCLSFTGSVASVGSVAVVLTATEANAGGCNRKVEDCNRSTTGPVWKGKGQLKAPISVTVCHGYWNMLDTGTYRGRHTKWWSPVMVYGGWYGDLETVTSECKTYSVKPGSEMRLFASCVDRVISTGKMTRSGRYVMQ